MNDKQLLKRSKLTVLQISNTIIFIKQSDLSISYLAIMNNGSVQNKILERPLDGFSKGRESNDDFF